MGHPGSSGGQAAPAMDHRGSGGGQAAPAVCGALHSPAADSGPQMYPRPPCSWAPQAPCNLLTVCFPSGE